jgi:hypothetical protein
VDPREQEAEPQPHAEQGVHERPAHPDLPKTEESLLYRQLSTCRMSRPHLPSVVSVGLTDAPIIEDADNRSQGVDQRYPLVVD